jgi:hypothetical protein
VGGVEAQRPLEEADAGGRLLVGQQLDIGEAGGVVDADVDELPAGAARALPLAPVARRAVPGAPLADPAELP